MQSATHQLCMGSAQLSSEQVSLWSVHARGLSQQRMHRMNVAWLPHVHGYPLTLDSCQTVQCIHSTLHAFPPVTRTGASSCGSHQDVGCCKCSCAHGWFALCQQSGQPCVQLLNKRCSCMLASNQQSRHVQPSPGVLSVPHRQHGFCACKVVAAKSSRVMHPCQAKNAWPLTFSKAQMLPASWTAHHKNSVLSGLKCCEGLENCTSLVETKLLRALSRAGVTCGERQRSVHMRMQQAQPCSKPEGCTGVQNKQKWKGKRLSKGLTSCCD